MNNSTVSSIDGLRLEYNIRVFSQSITLFFYAALYLLSFVVLLGRKVPTTVLQLAIPPALRASALNSIAKTNNSKPLPLLSCFALISVNLLLLLRIVVRIMALIDAALFLQHGEIINPILIQVGLGIELLGFALLMFITQTLLLLWVQSLQQFSESKYHCDNILYYIVVVICVIVSIVTVVVLTVAAVFYFTLQGIYRPVLHNLVVNFIGVPVYILLSVLVTLLMVIAGIRIIYMLSRGSTKLSMQAKVLITKLTLALITIPLANLIRLVGVALFAANIPAANIQSTFTAIGIPDFVTCFILLMCFWPYRLLFCCAAKRRDKVETTGKRISSEQTLLQALLEPIQFHLKRRNSEPNAELEAVVPMANIEPPVTPQLSQVQPVATPSTAPTPLTPTIDTVHVQLLPSPTTPDIQPI